MATTRGTEAARRANGMLPPMGLALRIAAGLAIGAPTLRAPSLTLAGGAASHAGGQGA